MCLPSFLTLTFSKAKSLRCFADIPKVYPRVYEELQKYSTNRSSSGAAEGEPNHFTVLIVIILGM